MLNHLLHGRPRRRREEPSIDGRVWRHLQDGFELNVAGLAAELRLTPEEVHQALLRLRADGLVSCRGDEDGDSQSELRCPWGRRRPFDTDSNSAPVQ